MSKTYSELDYVPIIAGDVEVPNFEPVTADYFANLLASGGHSLVPKWGWAKQERGHKTWAFYFLANHSNMGAAPDGSGYVTIFGMNNVPKVGRFAICKHEKQNGAGANHSRGWHPGRCSKCGLDMTIDSSD